MKIKLAVNDDIRVDGKLVAAGTMTNPIYFTSYLDDTVCGIGAFDEPICDTHNDGDGIAAQTGDWGSIFFNSGSDDSSPGLHG